jgi:hypothetical protein
MASLNMGELLRRLKSAYWKLLRFWAVDGLCESYSNKLDRTITSGRRYDSSRRSNDARYPYCQAALRVSGASVRLPKGSVNTFGPCSTLDFGGHPQRL